MKKVFRKLEKIPRKYMIIAIIAILSIIITIGGFSYAFFMNKIEKQAFNIVVGTLEYKLSSDSVEVKSGEHITKNITITSKNTIETKYLLYYTIDGYSEIPDGLSVTYDTTGSATSTIEKNGTKTIILYINNTTDKDITLNFGIKGGFINNALAVSVGAQEIVESVCDQELTTAKALISEAITAKGVATEATDSFETMAENISLIAGGNKLVEQTVEKTVSLSTDASQNIELTFDELNEIVGIKYIKQTVVSGYPSSWDIYSSLTIDGNKLIFPGRGDARGSSTIKFTVTATGYNESGVSNGNIKKITSKYGSSKGSLPTISLSGLEANNNYILVVGHDYITNFAGISVTGADVVESLYNEASGGYNTVSILKIKATSDNITINFAGTISSSTTCSYDVKLLSY